MVTRGLGSTCQRALRRHTYDSLSPLSNSSVVFYILFLVVTHTLLFYQFRLSDRNPPSVLFFFSILSTLEQGIGRAPELNLHTIIVYPHTTLQTLFGMRIPNHIPTYLRSSGAKVNRLTQGEKGALRRVRHYHTCSASHHSILPLPRVLTSAQGATL